LAASTGSGAGIASRKARGAACHRNHIGSGAGAVTGAVDVARSLAATHRVPWADAARLADALSDHIKTVLGVGEEAAAPPPHPRGWATLPPAAVVDAPSLPSLLAAGRQRRPAALDRP
jgi:hypothetical protein